MANLEQNIKRAISSIDNLQTAIENEIGESMENMPIERYVEILQAIFQKRKDITDIYIGYVFDETGSGSNQKGLYFVFSDGSKEIVTLPDIFSQELSLEQVEDGVKFLFNDAGVVKDYKVSNGVGIEKIEKTSSVGLVDTYTITLTDGNTTTFTVTNGSSSDGFNPDGDGTIIPSVEIDPTLTQSGFGADAKVVGDRFEGVDESIKNLENSLLEQINDLNDTVYNATEKVNGFEKTVNNNTAEVESLQEQFSGLEEGVGEEIAALDVKIPNTATVEENTLKMQYKRPNGNTTDLFSVELPESGGSDSEIPDPPKDNGTYKLNAFIKNNKKVYYWEKTDDSRAFYDYAVAEQGKLSPNDMFYYEKLFTLTQQDGDFYNSMLYSDSGTGRITIIDPEKWEKVGQYTHDKNELIQPHANSVSIVNANGVPYMYSNVYNAYASDETDKHIGECCVYKINESFAKDVTDIAFELGSLDSTTGKVLTSTTRKISDNFPTFGLKTILLDVSSAKYNVAICCYNSEQQYLGQLSADLQSLVTGSAQWISATTTASVSISMETLKTINSDIEYVRFILNSVSQTPNIKLYYDNVTNDTLVQILKIGFIENADLWTLTDSRPYGNFITDETNGFLYVYVPDNNTNSVKFHKFNIPSVTDGSYNTTYGCNIKILEEADIIESWTIPYYPSFIQGGCCKDNRLWITHGGGADYNGDAKMLVIDLTTKTIIATLDLLSAGIIAEPEFVGFYKEECYYGTSTDIYKLSFV